MDRVLIIDDDIELCELLAVRMSGEGFEIEADDYLPKPFNPRELIARIRAVLRRTVRVAAGTHPLIVGDLRLDPASREARIQGRLISITSVEFALLEMLMQHAGRIVTREELTETVL